METMLPVLLSVAVFAILMAGMAVGVIFRGKPLKGSCGGTGADCYCDRNNLPRACEQLGGKPRDHSHSHDHDHDHDDAAHRDAEAHS